MEKLCNQFRQSLLRLSHSNNEKSTQRNANTVLAVVRQSQKISSRRSPPFPGAQDSQNLISWSWSLPLPTDTVWWRSMHTILNYCVNIPTNKQDWLQYTVLLSLACSVIISTLSARPKHQQASLWYTIGTWGSQKETTWRLTDVCRCYTDAAVDAAAQM